MLIKNFRGSNFKGIVNYAYEGKLEKRLQIDKQAEIITYSDNLRIPYNSEDLDGRNAMIKDFQRQAKEKSGDPLKNSVGHHILNFNPKDKEPLSPSLIETIVTEYISERFLENTQYVAIRHHDTDNTHVHIIFNRVDNNGKVIDSNNNIDSTVIGYDLSVKYGLTQPPKQKSYVEKLQRSDPNFRENLGQRTNIKIAEASKTESTQILREQNKNFIKARNLHHLFKLCESSEQRFEKSEDGKQIIIDDITYQTAELEAVFKRNRDLAISKSKGEIGPRIREKQRADFKVKIDKYQTKQEAMGKANEIVQAIVENTPIGELKPAAESQPILTQNEAVKQAVTRHVSVSNQRPVDKPKFKMRFR